MLVRLALPIALAACWDAWRLLAGRIEEATSAVAILAVVAAFAWQAQRRGNAPVPRVALIAGLLLYALACWTGPALLQIGTAVAMIAFLLWSREGWPVVGLSLLALPVLPTLDFLLAYPLRHVSALIAAALLRLNGLAVRVEGVALEWHGQRLLFDGPCSGVRMLWAALLLASLVALIRRLGPWRYAQLCLLAIAAAVLGNGLRAASLFYLETGFLMPLQGPVIHEIVGLAAFLFLALALLVPAMRISGRPA